MKSNSKIREEYAAQITGLTFGKFMFLWLTAVCGYAGEHVFRTLIVNAHREAQDNVAHRAQLHRLLHVVYEVHPWIAILFPIDCAGNNCTATTQDGPCQEEVVPTDPSQSLIGVRAGQVRSNGRVGFVGSTVLVVYDAKNQPRIFMVRVASGPSLDDDIYSANDIETFWPIIVSPDCLTETEKVRCGLIQKRTTTPGEN